MTGIYRYINHTADMAFELEGDTFEELFDAACLAWKESVIAGFEISEREEKTLKFTESSIEELLVDFLSEINYFLLSKIWMTNEIKSIKIESEKGNYSSEITISGGIIDMTKYRLTTEIKAITYHQIEIKLSGGKIGTRLVFDI